MLKRTLRKIKIFTAGLTGNAMERPLNLLVAPGTLELDRSAGFIFFGRDACEILAGCGGLLACCLAQGSKCLLRTAGSPTGEERNALRELGIDPGSVLDWSEEESGSLPENSLQFYPFPILQEEKKRIEGKGQRPGGKRMFYDSRLLFLPEYTFKIDDYIEQKNRALEHFSSRGEPRASQAASAYRSAASGRGSGWYESFISFETGWEALSVVGED